MMIHIKRPIQKPILISPQVQPQKRINPPELENNSNPRSSAPRKYKKTKAIQTEKSELVSSNTDQQTSQNFEKILENLELKYDKSKSARYQINVQQQQNSKEVQNEKPIPIIKERDEIKLQNESVGFKTFIEFDMHGGDYHISNPFDWIQIMREMLRDAREQQIDEIKFIPGQGKHTNLNANKGSQKVDKPKDPILRALTLVTTKMLGYDSYIDINNKGVIICPISSYHSVSLDETETKKERRELIFSVFLGFSSFDLNETQVDLNDENYELKIKIIQTYKQIRNKVPNLINNCAEIISIWKKEEQDAIEFAQTFMKIFNENESDSKYKKQLKHAKIRDDRKKEQEMVNILKLTNKLQQKYGFDSEIIRRVVIEHKTEERCERVLDKIYHDMLLPYLFYTKNLRCFLSEYETIPITSLLDTFKECEYIPTVIQKRMCSQSFKDIRKALCLMKVDTNVDSKRAFNEFFNNQKLNIPKFVPSIEIDLKNAGIEKAISSISRIMDGLSIGEFCEMILIFSEENKKDDCCTIDDVRPFIEQKAKNDGYNICEIDNKKKFEYHFYIIVSNESNENNEDGANI